MTATEAARHPSPGLVGDDETVDMAVQQLAVSKGEGRHPLPSDATGESVEAGEVGGGFI